MEETFLIGNKGFQGQSWKVRKRRKGRKSGQGRWSIEHRAVSGQGECG